MVPRALTHPTTGHTSFNNQSTFERRVHLFQVRWPNYCLIIIEDLKILHTLFCTHWIKYITTHRDPRRPRPLTQLSTAPPSTGNAHRWIFPMNIHQWPVFRPVRYTSAAVLRLGISCPLEHGWTFSNRIEQSACIKHWLATSRIVGYDPCIIVLGSPVGRLQRKCFIET